MPTEEPLISPYSLQSSTRSSGEEENATVRLQLLPRYLPRVVQCGIFPFGCEALFWKGIFPAVLSTPLFHTSLYEIGIQASAYAVQMAKNYIILWHYRRHLCWENRESKINRENLCTSGGVTYLNKEGSIYLLTCNANEGKLWFSGADLELYPLVLCTDQSLERTVKLVAISVVFP